MAVPTAPRRQGRVGHDTERVTSGMDRKGEVGHIPAGGGGDFEHNHEEVTVSVA